MTNTFSRIFLSLQKETPPIYPSLLVTDKHWSTLFLSSSPILDISYKRIHAICILFYVASFSYYVFYFHLCCNIYQNFISFYSQIIFHWTDIPHFVYIFWEIEISNWQQLEITVHWKVIRNIKYHDKMRASGNIECIFTGSLEGMRLNNFRELVIQFS